MEKYLVLAAMVGCASFAHAQYSSPELMFVYDSGNSTNQAKIDRYDPISHQYLGSFGAGQLPSGQTGSMCVMGTTLYVLTADNVSNTSAIVGFNFSTGTVSYNHLVNQYRSGMAAANGKIYTSGDNGVINIVDIASNTSTSFVSPFGDQLISGISASTTGLGFTAYKGGSGFDEEVYNLDGAGNVGGLRFRVAPNPTLTGFAMSSAFTTNSTGGEDYLVAGQVSVFGGINKYSSTGVLIDNSISLTGGGIFVANSVLATGHNGETYYSRPGGTVAVLNSDLPYSFSGNGGVGIPLTNSVSPGLIAVYAAPEPAPFAFLGICAIGALVKRRRQTKTTK